ncbi:MAG: hypothetical protein J2P21_23540 [Chloracidobacterium sp.]|nr:hypothetical protein [Chloracidobacterium sp.]
MSLLEGGEIFSVQIRLRRTTIEYGYVNVEVMQDLIRPDGGLDAEKIFQRVLECGREPQMIWYKEEQIVEPHSIQQSREPHEKSLFKGKNGFEILS